MKTRHLCRLRDESGRIIIVDFVPKHGLLSIRKRLSRTRHVFGIKNVVAILLSELIVPTLLEPKSKKESQ